MRNILLSVQLIIAINCTLSQVKYDHTWITGNSIINPNNLMIFGDTLDIQYQKTAFGQGRGSTCISGTDGKLALYFNGCKLADGNHKIISDGFNLGFMYDQNCTDDSFGYFTGQQGNIFLPMPNIDDQYILFHNRSRLYFDVDSFKIYNDANYSLIQSNNNETKVLQKNVPLLEDTIIGGVYTAVKHSNGVDWWVICQDRYYTNGYYKILLTETGPVLHNYQNIGNYMKRGGQDGSQACFSPDGSRYAVFSADDGLFLMNFDRNTGIFSEFKHIPIYSEYLSSGCCFSPNGRFVYISNTEYLYQVDTEADSLDAELIAEWDGFREPGLGLPVVFGPMQTGPDCRIYVSTGRSPEYWGVIMKPDEKGKACQMLQHCIEFKANPMNIPHFPNFRLDTPYPYCDPNKVLITGTHDPWVTALSRQLIIYPNPGHDQMTITIPYQAQLPVSLTVRDINGRIVHAGRYDNNDDITIETFDWTSGMYVVQLVDRLGHVVSGKWVKE